MAEKRLGSTNDERDKQRKQGDASGEGTNLTQSLSHKAATGISNASANVARRVKKFTNPTNKGTKLKKSLSNKAAASIDRGVSTITNSSLAKNLPGFLNEELGNTRDRFNRAEASINQGVSSVKQNLGGFLNEEVGNTQRRFNTVGNAFNNKEDVTPIGLGNLTNVVTSNPTPNARSLEDLALGDTSEFKRNLGDTIGDKVEQVKGIGRAAGGVLASPFTIFSNAASSIGQDLLPEDPTTLTDPIEAIEAQEAVIEPRDPLGPLVEGDLRGTSQLNSQGGTTFNFDGGSSVSTNSKLGASRLANGQALRGGQVSQVNVQNIADANRAERISGVIAEGKRLGRSPGDILSIVNELDGTAQGGSQLQGQLDRIDEDERRGFIGSVVAAGRRNRINAHITARDRNAIDREGIAAGSDEFNRIQGTREANLGVATDRLELDQVKALTKISRDEDSDKLTRLSAIRKLLNDPTGTLDLSAAVSNLGPIAVFADNDGVAAINNLRIELPNFDDPQDKIDILTETANSLGITPEQVQEALNFNLQ